jgi:hypothetical protein
LPTRGLVEQERRMVFGIIGKFSFDFLHTICHYEHSFSSDFGVEYLPGNTSASNMALLPHSGLKNYQNQIIKMEKKAKCKL